MAWIIEETANYLRIRTCLILLLSITFYLKIATLTAKNISSKYKKLLFFKLNFVRCRGEKFLRSSGRKHFTFYVNPFRSSTKKKLKIFILLTLRLDLPASLQFLNTVFLEIESDRIGTCFNLD